MSNIENSGVSILLATYNERDNMSPLVEAIRNTIKPFNMPYEIIIVDDNSPDGTPEVVRSLDEKYPEVRSFVRMNERGLASAFWHGIEKVKYPYAVIMDSDFSHPPEDIARLISGLEEGVDMVWASRYVENGEMERTGSKRLQYYLSRLFNLFLQLFLMIPVSDSTGSFFVLKTKFLKMANPDVVFDGYGDFGFKLAYLLKKKRAFIKEIPFVYKERIYGESKTNMLRVGWLYFKECIRVRFSKKLILNDDSSDSFIDNIKKKVCR